MSLVLFDKKDWENATNKVAFLSKTFPMTRKVANQIKNLNNAIEAYERRCAALVAKYELIKSGYAGVNQQGAIVDRRIFKEATPVPAGNGAPEPKQV